MDSYLAKQPHGRNKGYITQYCLLVMLEKCKSAVNNEKYLRALLTDISKAFDCLSPKNFVSKLRSYDFDLAVVNLLKLPIKHIQNTKMNLKYSSWRKFYLAEDKDMFLVLRETCFNND